MRTEMDEIDLVRTMRADLPALDRAAETAARATLLAGMAAGTVAPSRARWRGPAVRLGLGLVTAAAAATAGLVAAPAGQDAHYANAAMEIEESGDGWAVRIKDGGADPAAYREAFEGVGLESDFRFVSALTSGAAPAAPAGTPEPEAPSAAGDPPAEIRIEACAADVPPSECDLRVVISGEVDPDTVLNGGDALPGKAGQDGGAATELRGLTVAEAKARLDALGLRVAYASGTLADDGTGTLEIPGRPWRPADTAKVTGGYLSADDEVTLIAEEPLD